MRYAQRSSLKTGISILKTFAFVGVALLTSGFKSDVEQKSPSCRSAALIPARRADLPSVKGWKIEAVKRDNAVMCSARQAEENSQRMTLLADTGKYRGGVWFLDIFSRNHRLEPGEEKTVAHLFLDGEHVVTGNALAVGGMVLGKPTGPYVRFDFPAIDAFVKDIKAACVVEVQAHGLTRLKLESLSPIIAAIEDCQRQASNPEFWENAKYVCN